MRSRYYNKLFPNHYTHWHSGEIKTLKRLVKAKAMPHEFENELGRPYVTCMTYYKAIDKAERQLKLLRYGTDEDTLVSMRQKEKEKKKK